MFGSAAFDRPQRQATLDAWRTAERVVQSRWDLFLIADRSTRRVAFAAYQAALDTEAAAASALAHASSDLAGAA